MGPVTTYPQPFFQWLLQTSWQASVLICLILLIQRFLGRQLGVRGRYWLWLVVLVRMAMFWAPPSPVSVHNLLPLPQWEGYRWAATPQSGNVGSALAATNGAFATERRGKADPTANGTQKAGAPASLSARARLWENARTIILWLWLAGACVLAGHIIAGYVHLWRIVRRKPPVINRRIRRLLKDCQKQMGIRRAVEVVAIDRIESPALFGFIRPRLLLPRQTLADLSLQELRYVFLHELAHLKRHDILISYLVTLLQVLHWFNPLIALGFKRMRADREMVCDELALSVLPPEETSAYGRTVVHQIEQLLTSRPHRMLAALSGDRARIKQRIAMISQFRQETRRRSPLAIMIVGLLAIAGLSNGLAAGGTWDDYARQNFPTTHQDRHANIQRACIRNLDTGKYLVVDGDRVTCDANEPGEAGLWEFRFDEVLTRRRISCTSIPLPRKYLTSDKQGNLAVDALEPNEAARWGTYPHPQGVWLISHNLKDGYLRLDEQGRVRAESMGRDIRSYWDVHTVWRIKTSDNPKSNPQWQREHAPGPD